MAPNPRISVLGTTTTDAYLARIGAESAPPSVEALFALHRAHQLSLSHESTWIHLGEAWTLDPLAAIHRFTTTGRGGYCYHLNGSFAALLNTLGYSVTMHRGAVHGPDGPTDGLGNHMVLHVSDLPSPANPDGTWHVDVGLGEGLLEPLPLIEGAFSQAPIEYTLQRVEGDADLAHGDWRLAVDHAHCNVKFVSFDSTPAALEDFATHHQHQSNEPTSLFVSMLLAHRRDETGIDSMIGLVLGRIERERTQRTLDNRHDWFDALADVFGITLSDCDATQRDALWAKTHAAHVAWQGG